MRAEQITDPIAYHGEGPAWSPSWGGLRWVDMLAGDFLTLRDDRIERQHVAEVAAAVRPRRGGGAVIGIERGFALESPDGQIDPLARSVDFAGHPHERGRLRSAGELLVRIDGLRPEPRRGIALVVSVPKAESTSCSRA